MITNSSSAGYLADALGADSNNCSVQSQENAVFAPVVRMTRNWVSEGPMGFFHTINSNFGHRGTSWCLLRKVHFAPYGTLVCFNPAKMHFLQGWSE